MGRLWQQPHEDEPNEREHTLNWLNAAFVGDPQDVSNWPVLDPLAPHAKAVAGFADQAGIMDPTARLIGAQGVLQFCKAAHSDAEPLMRRMMEILFDFGQQGFQQRYLEAAFGNSTSLLQKMGLSESEIKTKLQSLQPPSS